MGTDITPSKAFQEKLFERIRAEIGTLMGEEDLKKVVAAAMEKAFFEERVTHREYGRSVEKPPLLVELITELLRQRVDVAIKAWLEENNERVAEAIKAVLANGIATTVIKSLDFTLSPAFFQLQASIQQALSK